jgi:hypothetical protein
VLVSLDALDKERRILIAGDKEREDEDMIRRGTEMLKEMSVYNSIATRYAQSLEQLRTETRAAASVGIYASSTNGEPAMGSVQAAFQSAPNPLFLQEWAIHHSSKTPQPSRTSLRAAGAGWTSSGMGTVESVVDQQSPWQGGMGSRSRSATEVFNPRDTYSSAQDGFSCEEWLSASWLGGNVSLEPLPLYRNGPMPMEGLFMDDPMMSDVNLANFNFVP